MPSSATLFGNNVPDGGEAVYLSWEVATQEINNNRSLITWYLGWRFDTYSCRGLRNGSATINGVNVYSNFNSGDGVHQFNAGHEHRPTELQVATGQLWIGHNADGTQNISVSATLTGFSSQTSSGSSSWALPTIPRFSSPPSKPVISSITQNSFFVTFTDGTGGAPIDGREIRYGTNSSGSGATIVASDGSTSITGLSPGTKYYVWARTHNAAGYSDWSQRSDATTWTVPSAPTAPTISLVEQTTARVSWSAPSNGGTAITGYDIARNTVNSTTGATIVSDSSSPNDQTGLTPGVKYYWFVRAKNVVGNGAWSPSSNATTVAGARVKSSGVYKQAVPYVKHAGVWKVARPYGKILGLWKKSI